jgi:hypothetical protein
MGLRDPAAASPLGVCDEVSDRRAAHHAVAVSAAGLGATGLAGIGIAVVIWASAAFAGRGRRFAVIAWEHATKVQDRPGGRHACHLV